MAVDVSQLLGKGKTIVNIGVSADYFHPAIPISEIMTIFAPIPAEWGFRKSDELAAVLNQSHKYNE